MYWNEDKEKQPEFVVPDDVVDLAFKFSGSTLPLDHAHGLSRELLSVLPWLAEEAHAGIHLIHGATSGNGWYRPEDPATELLHLSRRCRMRLRVPNHRLDDARELTGKTLDVDGHVIEVGEATVFRLSSLSTLFARHVITDAAVDENEFLEQATRQLHALDIPCRKMLGGITHTMQFPDGPVHTRSLMVAELQPEQSVRLQQVGLGPGRSFGCGLFLPHKGIKPVKSDDQ
ncbi:MAG: type I-MYXAN CRISPR-associated protein Cas6/Cmx6 [Gammaproteobacteria bacterium]